MEWRDQGILLGLRRHGETSAILDVFTPERGRHAGVMRGATSRKIAPSLQPGAQLDVAWRARLEDHLGTFTVEPIRSRAAVALGNRQALAGLNAVTALVSFALPEREAHPVLYRQTEQLLDLLDQPELWPLAYLRWEMQLLEDTGFGLDLDVCAVTGSSDELVYVSPRTGRAVSSKGAGEWAPKLLPLPPILRGKGDTGDAEILQALQITGHFLTHSLAAQMGNKPLPEARMRFVSVFARAADGV